MTLVLLIILLIIILLLLLYYNHTKNYFTNNINTNINIGNTLADYFFNLGKAIINTTEFKNTKNGDFNDIIFFKDLPNEIKMNTYTEWSQVYNNFKMNYNNLDEIRNTINIEHGSSMWECIDKTRESFWISMKPIINRILNDTFKKSNLMKDINYPIIHFRCADTPFVKHKAYHLQKYSFFKDALNEIKNTTNIFDNQKKILILYNNTHYSNEENKTACNIYADKLKNYIKTLGYEPFIDTYSDIDDFALLFYAPAVISTHSSFSFMSGFFGNGKFISAGHFYENDNNIQICNDCGPWLYKGYDLYHKNVNDYHDTKTIVNKLNELLDKFSNTPQITFSSCFYI